MCTMCIDPKDRSRPRHRFQLWETPELLQAPKLHLRTEQFDAPGWSAPKKQNKFPKIKRKEIIHVILSVTTWIQKFIPQCAPVRGLLKRVGEYHSRSDGLWSSFWSYWRKVSRSFKCRRSQLGTFQDLQNDLNVSNQNTQHGSRPAIFFVSARTRKKESSSCTRTWRWQGCASVALCRVPAVQEDEESAS